jgi:signal transduction histidine kinase
VTSTVRRGVSLRWRLLLISVACVAVALAIGSLALYAVLNVAGQRALDDRASNTANDVAVLVRGGSIPDPLPVSGAQLVQVVDGQDRVLGASASADRLTSLLRPDELAQARNGSHLTVPGQRVGSTGHLRVVALPVTAPSDRTPDQSTVIVAVQAADYERAQAVLGGTLLLTYPVLLAALGIISWWVIGRTLRPVEELRAGAESISGEGRDERLPVGASTDEIAALAVTLNRMLDRLSAARERQRDFVADAAHELRSPLASMRTQLEVAQHLGEAGDLPEDLLADVSRLSGLVEDLLLLARLERPTAAPARLWPVDVRELLDEVVGRYAGARVRVAVCCREGFDEPAGDRAGRAPGTAWRGGEPLTVTADPEHLRRVLTNLVDNAVRHADSQVSLACGAEPGRVLLIVSDDGPGIPPAQRERVFERFARLDDARDRDAGGSGLGLAIVRELVARLGGTVTLADAGSAASPRGDHPGLRVEVRLPRTPHPAPHG